MLPIAELLLSRGANIDLPTTQVNMATILFLYHLTFLNFDSSMYRQAKSVPLIVAACHGKDAMVCMLLQHGANVHCGTVLDVTALIWAVEKCSHDTVTALLDAGANPWHATKVRCSISECHHVRVIYELSFLSLDPAATLP